MLQERLRIFRLEHPRSEQVDGVRWRYLAGGRGERTALLLPGGTRVPDIGFSLVQALERDYRVIAPSYLAVPTMAELIEES